MRLIDADQLYKELKSFTDKYIIEDDVILRTVITTMNMVLRSIELMPTAELKKGKWIPAFEIGNGTYKCSRCGVMTDASAVELGIYSYCPKCGADMRDDIK